MTARPPAYQERPRADVARAWTNAYVDARDLLRMIAWKSAKGLASVTLNEADRVLDVTCETIGRLRDGGINR